MDADADPNIGAADVGVVPKLGAGVGAGALGVA